MTEEGRRNKYDQTHNNKPTGVREGKEIRYSWKGQKEARNKRKGFVRSFTNYLDD